MSLSLNAMGLIDDGTESGAVRVYTQVAGDVMEPLWEGEYQAGLTGATLSMNYGTDPSKLDLIGSARALFVSVANAVGNSAVLDLIVQGPTVGFVYQRNFGSYTGNFSCSIDGEEQEVIPNSLIVYDTQTNSFSGTSGQLMAYAVRNLSNKPHFVRLSFQRDPAGTASWLLYGKIKDRGAGAVPITPGTFHIGTTTASSLILTTTPAVINVGGTPSNRPQAISSIDFFNFDSQDRIVTVTEASNITWQNLCPTQRTITWGNGNSRVLDINNFKLSIDSGSSVRYKWWGPLR